MTHYISHTLHVTCYTYLDDAYTRDMTHIQETCLIYSYERHDSYVICHTYLAYYAVHIRLSYYRSRIPFVFHVIYTFHIT